LVREPQPGGGIGGRIRKDLPGGEWRVSEETRGAVLEVRTPAEFAAPGAGS